jgi:hypothetical protein
VAFFAIRMAENKRSRPSATRTWSPAACRTREFANMALEILEVTSWLSAELKDELTVRVGIHIGPAVAG